MLKIVYSKNKNKYKQSVQYVEERDCIWCDKKLREIKWKRTFNFLSLAHAHDITLKSGPWTTSEEILEIDTS